MNEQHDLAKWLAGEMSGDELAAFEKSSDFALYQKISTHSAELEVPAFDQDAMYRRIISQKAEKPVVPLYRSLLRVAAVLVIAFGLYFATKALLPVSESAGNGQIASFFLPDASQVVLNAGSTVKYKKWGWSNDRTLELDGEAYFKVAKGQKFEVNTTLGKVTVLGTQFDVKARGNRFDVVCYEGKVRVDYGNEQRVIGKGQAVSFADGQPMEVQPDNPSAPSWLAGQIVFNRETREAVIEELRRQYDVEIAVDAKPSTQLFTGVLPMKNLDQALGIVCATYHLKSLRQNGKIILDDN